MRRYIPAYITGIVFLLLTNSGQLYLPQLIKRAIDSISLGTASGRSILGLVGAMGGIAIAIAVGRSGWRFFIHGASRRVEKQFRDDLFAHLLKLSSSFYGNMKTGDIMARATNDMNNIRQASGFAFVSFVDGIFMTMTILIIMFSRYPRVAILTILPLPILTAMTLSFGKLLGKRFGRVQEGYLP